MAGLEVLLTREQIGARVKELGAEISRDFAFAYRLISEVVPLNYVRPPDSTNYMAPGIPAAELVSRSNLWVTAQNEARNLGNTASRFFDSSDSMRRKSRASSQAVRCRKPSNRW